MSSQQEARRDEGDTRKRGQEAELRDQAHLSRQRHIKQATQFLHKDSADLLPLDSLKRLGTSKDLVRHPFPPTPRKPPALSLLFPCPGEEWEDQKGQALAFRFPFLAEMGRWAH
jgi:hypothetical protein